MDDIIMMLYNTQIVLILYSILLLEENDFIIKVKSKTECTTNSAINNLFVLIIVYLEFAC